MSRDPHDDRDAGRCNSKPCCPLPAPHPYSQDTTIQSAGDIACNGGAEGGDSEEFKGGRLRYRRPADVPLRSSRS